MSVNTLVGQNLLDFKLNLKLLGIILEKKMSEILSYQKMSTVKVVHLSLFF